MLCCWHFWLVCLCFPQFLPGNSHGNSPAGKLCRHHELIVLLLLFRAVYPSGLRQVRNPQQLPQPWPGAPLVPPEQLLGSRGAGAQPPLGRNWTDGLRTVFHTRTFSSCTALPTVRGSRWRKNRDELQLPSFPMRLICWPMWPGRYKWWGVAGSLFCPKSLPVACCAAKLLLLMKGTHCHCVISWFQFCSLWLALTADSQGPQSPRTFLKDHYFLLFPYHKGPFLLAHSDIPGLKGPMQCFPQRPGWKLNLVKGGNLQGSAGEWRNQEFIHLLGKTTYSYL